MAFDFASVKAQARRVLHDTLAVQAFYQDNSMIGPEEIRARWHNKQVLPMGDLNNEGYADVLEGVDRIVLFPGDTPGITFRKNGTVTFPDYGLAFTLDTLEPRSGALQAVWKVTRA